jgi:SH3-like domain-containing protein
MKRLLFVSLLMTTLAACQNSVTKTSNNAPASAKPAVEVNQKNVKPSLNKRRTCQFSAYVNDRGPKGLNVRSAPGSNQRVITKLPRKDAIFVDIIACEGEWVQISKAESNDKVEFQGKGWVYAPLLGTSTRGYGTNGVFLYASASINSKKLTRIPADMAVKLLGGDGAWVLVEYKNMRGWLAPEDQCPNPLTTCS